MATQQAYQPTASQFAAAHMHLDRRSEWRGVRIAGERYVILPSGRTDHVYTVRADAAGCSCPWSLRTGTECSHRLAVYLAATEDHLADMIDDIDAAIAEAFVRLVDMRAELPGCAGGCGQIVPQSNLLFCDDCSAARERQERMAAARRRVVEAWL